MIRLGSLAGYPFEGPRLLAGWTPPARPAVFAIMYKPEPDAKPEKYAVIYAGHSDDLSAERFPFSHPRASCWVRRTGSRFKVYICTYEVPGGNRPHREQITKELGSRRPDEALARAGRAVFDWEGGTRIGDSLDAFVRGYGRRGLARGGVVVVCSDGLDRGDPEVLATAAERLSRLCHRLVWMNPHKGDDAGFRPSTLGMMVVAPHVDLILSGHDLSSLEEFAALLPSL